VKNIPSLRFFSRTIKANVESALKKEESKVSIPAKFPVLANVSIGPSFGLFIMNNSVNSGEGTGNKFEYIEQYHQIYKGKIDIFHDQSKWHNETYDDLLSKMA
jgi:hypothetical protein